MALIDPPDVVGLVEIVPIEVVIDPGQLWQPLIGNDAQRLFFVVTTQPGNLAYGVWPEPLDDLFGIVPAAGQVHVLIHYASYPALCQGPWLVSVAPGVVRVVGYAVRRQ